MVSAAHSVPTLVAFTILAACESLHAPYRYDGVTDAEVREITHVVRACISQRITSFKVDTRGETTLSQKPLRGRVIEVQGSGQELFQVRKSRSRWEVVDRSHHVLRYGDTHLNQSVS
jgi:hypothetical protein